MKYKIKYPQIGFYESWESGKILNPDCNDLIFINIKFKKYHNFMKDIKKIGNIRNFSSGKETFFPEKFPKCFFVLTCFFHKESLLQL